MRQFENLRKMDIFEKNRNLRLEYLLKKGSIKIVTSFSQIQTIMKLYFAKLDVFKISSLTYNYVAIWKFKKNGHF